MDLETSYKQEISQLRDGFELERKEIEQAYKMEITDIEEQHQKEKQEVLSLINRSNVSTSLYSIFSHTVTK